LRQLPLEGADIKFCSFDKKLCSYKNIKRPEAHRRDFTDAFFVVQNPIFCVKHIPDITK
jgi:hypothetical protein